MKELMTEWRKFLKESSSSTKHRSNLLRVFLTQPSQGIALLDSLGDPELEEELGDTFREVSRILLAIDELLNEEMNLDYPYSWFRERKNLTDDVKNITKRLISVEDYSSTGPVETHAILSENLHNLMLVYFKFFNGEITEQDFHKDEDYQWFKEFIAGLE